MAGDAQLQFRPHNALGPIPGRHPKGLAGQSPLPITDHKSPLDVPVLPRVPAVNHQRPIEILQS